MAFNPPLRSDMGGTVLRALRDPSGSIFPPATIEDFISQAMADLSAYRPKEAKQAITWPFDDPSTTMVDFTSIWKVEFVVATPPSGYQRTIGIPYGDPHSSENRAGWDFYGGALYLPEFWVTRLNLTSQDLPAEMWLWGYRDRDIPTSDADILDLSDATDYVCVLNHCKSMGFELLTHDRSLYQQWLAATNNTDVSPTQLSGMANFAEGTFQRSRARNTKMRRVPSGDYLRVY